MISQATALEFLRRNLNRTNGETVSFRCAATGNTVAQVTAVRGHSTVLVQDTSGTVLQIASTDFIVTASDITGVNGGNTYTPAKGDRVTAADGVFELMTPSYTPSDHTGARLRLHTVRISS